MEEALSLNRKLYSQAADIYSQAVDIYSQAVNICIQGVNIVFKVMLVKSLLLGRYFLTIETVMLYRWSGNRLPVLW